MSMESHTFGLGFPLGTALLLVIIVIFSGIFSCCYQRGKLLSQRRRGSHPTDLEAATHALKLKSTLTCENERSNDSLPVLMPGDQVPKFIAMPCPRQPPRPGKNDDIFLEVQKTPKLAFHVVVPLS